MRIWWKVLYLMRRDPWIPEWTGGRSYDQGEVWNAGESKKIINVRSEELLKQTNPDEKGISFLPYSRDTSEKMQVQMVIRFPVGPIQMAWSPPQPGEGFRWSSLANMTKAPSALLLPELGLPEISLLISHGSSPFSNWEITPGLESWYPAHEEENTACAEVKEPSQEFKESSLVFRTAEE